MFGAWPTGKVVGNGRLYSGEGVQIGHAQSAEAAHDRIKKMLQEPDIALEAFEEHYVVDTVMPEIDEVVHEDEAWGEFKS